MNDIIWTLCVPEKLCTQFRWIKIYRIIIMAGAQIRWVRLLPWYTNWIKIKKIIAMISVLEINHVKWSLFKKRNNTGAWGSIYRLHSKYHDVHDTCWVYVYIEIQAPVRKKFPLLSFIMTCLFTRTMKIQWRIILKRRKRGRRKKGTCIIWSPRTFFYANRL